MSLGSMAAELTGVVPNLPPDYARTLVLRAWADVCRQNLWSFLMGEANWTSPSIVNAGTVATTQGLNTVTFNAAASAAIIAIGFQPSPVVARQFRIGIGTIYNIWAMDTTTPTAVVLTLDRPFAESSSAASPYQIGQWYYPAPVKDFKAWLNVRDMTNFNDLITTKSRSWIDDRDPQRTISYIPSHCVPYQMDLNPASGTYRYMLFELWGQPVYQLTYQLAYMRTGVGMLVNNADEIPPQIGEDCVLSLGRYYAYQWGEANWQTAWGVKPNFAFLMRQEVCNDRRPGRELGVYNRLFGEYRKQDREAVVNYTTRLRRRSGVDPQGFYNSISGSAFPGLPW